MMEDQGESTAGDRQPRGAEPFPPVEEAPGGKTNSGDEPKHRGGSPKHPITVSGEPQVELSMADRIWSVN